MLLEELQEDSLREWLERYVWIRRDGLNADVDEFLDDQKAVNKSSYYDISVSSMRRGIVPPPPEQLSNVNGLMLKTSTFNDFTNYPQSKRLYVEHCNINADIDELLKTSDSAVFQNSKLPIDRVVELAFRSGHSKPYLDFTYYMFDHANSLDIRRLDDKIVVRLELQHDAGRVPHHGVFTDPFDLQEWLLDTDVEYWFKQ